MAAESVLWRRAAASLAGCGLLAVALLQLSADATRPAIEAAREAAQRAALRLVLPPRLHDNDPRVDALRVRAPRWLGRQGEVAVLRARLGAALSAVVVEASAPNGYAGPIDLLIAIDRDGEVLGVRVTEHHETPGLGDPIDAERSDWIQRFSGRALDDPRPSGWAVRKDGGEFDQFAGATVTPRAVVAAVKRSLAWYARHRDALDAAPINSLLEFDDGPQD